MKLADRVLILLERYPQVPKEYLDNPTAMKIINSEIKNMLSEITSSTRGTRGQVGYGKDVIQFATKSTFPAYLQDIFNGQGTVDKFAKAVKRGKGPVWDRIALEAIDRLKNGYKNDHGYNEPDEEFLDAISPVPF